MRTNNECIRKVLIKIEGIPYGETYTVSKLQELLPEFSIEDVIYTVTMLNRERYIMIMGKPGYDDDDVFRDNKIRCLTERGYRNLDLIRDDNVWNLIKEKLPDYNEISFYTILAIANKIYNKKHNEIFDIPNEFYMDYSRW